MTGLLCSIVVPTRQRPGALGRLLASLAKQTADAPSFETIVVLDGPDRHSSRALDAWEASGRLPNLRHFVRPRSGQAGARNFGCEHARSPVVLFLDDDMEADATLVATHQAHHRGGERIAVLGDSRVALGERPSWHELQAWAWWEEKLHARFDGRDRPCYTDFCSGNVSLRVEDFRAVGGFDADFHGYGLEDYELGWRLLDAGVGFVADRAAVAAHHHSPTLSTALVRHRAEGQAEVLLGLKHPNLRAGLRLMTFPRRRLAWKCRLAFSAPRAGDALAALGLVRLGLYEKLSKRRSWAVLYDALRAYWFWRGVALAVGSFEDLLRFQAAAPAVPKMHVDLSGTVPDPDDLLPAVARGVPIDVAVGCSGRPVTVVRVPSGIGRRVRLREELIRALAAQPAVRLALATAAPVPEAGPP